MAFADPHPEARPLNPNMVYRPLSPSHDQQDGDGDSDRDEEPIKFRFNFVAILRVIIIIFDIAATSLALSSGGYPLVVAVITFEYISMVWNLLELCRLWAGGLSKSQACYGRVRFGFFHCACGEDDHDHHDRPSASSSDDNDKKKGKWRLRSSIVDLLLGFILIIIVPIDLTYVANFRSWYRRPSLAAPILGLIIMVLEVFVGLLSYFRVFRGVRVEIYPDESSTSQFGSRIRLPQSPPSENPTSSSVSVAA